MAHLQKSDSDRSIFKKKLLKNFSCLHDEQQVITTSLPYWFLNKSKISYVIYIF